MQRAAILLAALVAGITLLLAGVYTLVELRAMDKQLQSVSARLVALEQMNDKLSETNRLLQTTNVSLRSMIAASTSANKKLGAMRADLATMSHKISGSFLFRGVK